MRVVGVLQARMGSERVPGKVLMDLGGATTLARIIERVRMATLLNDLVVATTDELADQAIFRECRRLGVNVIAASSQDAIESIHQVARAYSAHAIAGFSGDAPLVDPEWTDLLLRELMTGFHDYVGVTDLPIGVAPECFTYRALDRCYRTARTSTQGNTIAQLFKGNPQLFDVQLLQAPSFQRAPWMRLTVDTDEDFRRMRALYRRFHQPGRIISVTEVIQALVRERSAGSRNSREKPCQLVATDQVSRQRSSDGA